MGTVGTVIAKWGGLCPKCDRPWSPGDLIKPRFVPAGVLDGKMTYRRVAKAYVHEVCPKPPPGVDPQTGEVLVVRSGMPRLWEDQ